MFTGYRRHPFADVVRGLTALVVLAACVIGVPWAMVGLHADPIPHHLPTLHQAWQRLSEPDDGTILIGALTVVVWVAWAVFTVMALAEVAGRIARIRIPRLAGLGAMQDGVGALVAAAAVLLSITPWSGPTAAGRVAASLVPTQPPHRDVRPEGVLPARGAAETHGLLARAGPASVPPVSDHPGLGLPRYTVVRHDTLWRVAERYLGDGLRYQEIAALNEGRPQPDGRRFTTAGIIHPGWVLLLPVDATGLPSHDAPTVESTADRDIVVQPGDTLWDLAEHQYGDGAQYPRILDANKSRIQPDGLTLTDPDVIQPGWHLTVPAAPGPAAAPPVGPPGGSRPGPPSGGNVPPTTVPTPPAPPPTAPSPSPSTGPSRAESPAPTPSRAVPPTPTPADTPERSGERRAGGSVLIWLVSGGLVGVSLAAAVSAALVRARRQRLRRYRPGVPGRHHDVQPLPPSVRTMFRAHMGESTPGASITELPFGPVAVAVRADGDQDAEVAMDPVGLGGLGLTGPGAPGAARALLIAYLARRGIGQVEILIPRTDLANLMDVGSDQDAGPRLPENLTVTERPDDALSRMETERITRTRLLDTEAVNDIGALRESCPDEPLPTLLLVTSPDPATRHRMSAVARFGAGCDIGVVLLGDWPDGATYHIESEGQATQMIGGQPGAEEDVRFFHLPVTDAADLLDLLADADGTLPDSPPNGADDGPPDVEVEAPSPPEPSGAEVVCPVMLAMFGPARLYVHGEEVATGLRTNARELLLYLALRSQGATVDELLDALWPEADQVAAKTSFHAAVGNIRKVLRDTTGLGSEKFLLQSSGRYQLDPNTVEVDLWQFRRALHQARHAASDADKASALGRTSALYRGSLAEGLSFDWLERDREHARRDVLDVLSALAQLNEAHDPEAALGVLDDALIHDPYSDELYQRVMRLQARLGRPDAVRRTYQLLKAQLAEIDADPAPATERLLHSLVSTTAREG